MHEAAINRASFLDRRPALCLLAIVALAVALRAHHIGAASLWNDELFSRYYAVLPLHFLWTRGFTLETNPPTYYSLLHYWMRVFGTGAAALRSLSLLASVATVPLVYALAREFAARPAALLAALLFAIAPMQIYYGQEARTYALLLLPISVALIGLARTMRAPSAPNLILYGVGAALAVYMHTTVAILLVAINLAFVAAQIGRPAAVAWRSLRPWIVTNLVVALLSLPEAFAILREMHADRFDWLPPTSLHDVTTSLGELLAGPATYPPRFGALLAVLLLAAMAAGVWVSRPGRRPFTVLVLVPALYFALVLLESLHEPILIPRILCWMGVPVAVLLACLLLPGQRLMTDWAVPQPATHSATITVSPAIRAAGVAGLALWATAIAAFATGIGFQLGQGQLAKEPWRIFLERLQPELASADVIALGPDTEPTPLAYYGTSLAKVRHWTENDPPTVETTVIPQELGVQDISRQALIADIRQHKSVLLIQRLIEYPTQHLLTDAIPPTRLIRQSCGHNFCLEALYWDGRA